MNYEYCYGKEKIWTDEEFMALSGENDRYELIDGELVNMGNSGMEEVIPGFSLPISDLFMELNF